MSMAKHWSKLPKEAVGTPSLEIFQILPGKALRNGSTLMIPLLWADG